MSSGFASLGGATGRFAARSGGGRRNPPHEGSAIIPFLASKFLSLMLLGVPGLKKTLISLAVLVAASVTIVACGSYNSATSQHMSGLKFRAFVSNPLAGGGSVGVPAINIVDASRDVLSPATISLL